MESIFLTIDLDDDGLPTAQRGLAPSSVVEAVSAAPVGLGYVVCGSGDNTPITAVPINQLAPADLELGSNTIQCRTLTYGNGLIGASTAFITLNGSVSCLSGLYVSGNSSYGVSCVGVDNITVNTCPIPNPVCYAQLDSAGTAGPSEIKFGAGVTPTTTNDPSNQITWDNTNKWFSISASGTYHVLATLVVNVSTTTLPTLRVKRGSTVINVFSSQGINGAEDPEEVTIQAVMTCSSGDNINITHQDDGSANVYLSQGSSVLVKRLF